MDARYDELWKFCEEKKSKEVQQNVQKSFAPGEIEAMMANGKRFLLGE